MKKLKIQLNNYLSTNSLDKGLLLILFFSTLFVLIYNIFNYKVNFGYDADAHIRYVNAFAMYLPRTFRIPLSSETYEFFSPPVGYIFPAFVHIICRNLFNAPDLVSYCVPIYGKFTQVFQSILYFFTIYFYMKTINLYFGKKSKVNLSIFLLISLLTVNYRTISMIRGEPYILFFLSISIYLFMVLIKSEFKYIKTIILLGLTLGLLGLSRQWGLLIFPAFFISFLFVDSSNKRNYLKMLLIVFSIALIIITPFFISLYQNYGSITSFNKESYGFDLNNQPVSFYSPFNSEALKVFTKPIRGNFDNQFLPILYSDLWGDYWGYFSFTSNFLDQGRNQKEIGDYLARVNIFSIIPTIFLVLGFLNLKKMDTNKIFNYFIKFAILSSFIGYLWFLVSYPEIPSGDTIKSTYIIQMFHLLAFSAAIYLEKIKESNLKKYNIIVLVLFIVYFHNIPSMLSHFGNVSI